MHISNLRHIIATFALLPSRVRSQPGPYDIQVSQLPLTQGGIYTVSWHQDDKIFIGDISLLEAGEGMEGSQQSNPLVIQDIRPLPQCSRTLCSMITLSTQSAIIFTMSAPLNPFSSYKVEIQYTTTNIIANSDVLSTTFGSPFAATSTSAALVATGPASLPPKTTTSGVLVITAASSKAPLAGTTTTTDSTSNTGSSNAGIPSSAQLASSDSSSGLGTGAKVGIAIGAVAVVLFILIGALLCWRRRKQQKGREFSPREPFHHDLGSTNHDLTVEKEINVMSSPVTQFTPTNTWGSDRAGATPATQPAQTERVPQTNSWVAPEEHVAAPHTDEHAGPYSDENRMSTHSPASFTGSNTSRPSNTPAPGAAPAMSRKPVAVPVHHLHEPGMSEEEVARLEEEERRLDEAIAEAERRRELQRRDS